MQMVPITKVSGSMTSSTDKELRGARYEGQYNEGKKEGRGRLTFADTSFYDGEFS
jgi:hypothetical protein